MRFVVDAPARYDGVVKHKELLRGGSFYFTPWEFGLISFFVD